jgi:DNA-binding transcriptional ArsR family regulator
MGEHELCVCYFVEILGGPQPKISRHLAYLRNAGIVSARRDGKWMHYRIVMPPHIGATQILRQTLDWLKEDQAMQADRARLTKACCSPSKYPPSKVLRCLLLSPASPARLADGLDQPGRAGAECVERIKHCRNYCWFKAFARNSRIACSSAIR